MKIRGVFDVLVTEGNKKCTSESSIIVVIYPPRQSNTILAADSSKSFVLKVCSALTCFTSSRPSGFLLVHSKLTCVFFFLYEISSTGGKTRPAELL